MTAKRLGSLSAKEAAPLLGLAERTVHKLLRARERGEPVNLPPARRVGGGRGNWIFPLAGFEAWLAREHQAPEFRGSTRRKRAAVRGNRAATSRTARRLAHRRKKVKGGDDGTGQ